MTTRYQISPTYSDYRTALEFCRLAEGNEEMHIAGTAGWKKGYGNRTEQSEKSNRKREANNGRQQTTA